MVISAWSNFLLGGWFTPEWGYHDTNAEAAGLPRTSEWKSHCITPSPSISDTGQFKFLAEGTQIGFEKQDVWLLGAFKFKSATLVMENELCVCPYICVFMVSVTHSVEKNCWCRIRSPKFEFRFLILSDCIILNKSFVFLKPVSPFLK